VDQDTLQVLPGDGGLCCTGGRLELPTRCSAAAAAKTSAVRACHWQGGDLLKHLHDVGTLAADAARTIFTQLLKGIAFCHSLGVMHRDLKLENVLLATPTPPNQYLVKISDFGLSDLRPFSLSGTYCGSPLYAAPELMDGNVRPPQRRTLEPFAQAAPTMASLRVPRRQARAASPEGYDAERSDMWSCGVVLYALLTSSLPFDADDMTELVRLVVHGVPRRPLPRHCGARAADLVSQLITREPSKRLTAAGCLEHV